MFYNSNKETGSLLSKSRKKAETQDAKILNAFKRHFRLSFTAYEIWRYRFPDFPITSIRRSINTLWNDGKIHDIGFRLGGYGKVNRVYKFKKS